MTKERNITRQPVLSNVTEITSIVYIIERLYIHVPKLFTEKINFSTLSSL